mmetsp:Transcript_311/g.318  ORF Transcript_311/g.318 Transcript_311/m.318 type:complete len:127 (-) Transcript_311:55-435(-)
MPRHMPPNEIILKTTTDPVGGAKCSTLEENRIPAEAGPHALATEPPSMAKPCKVPLWCADTVRFTVIVRVVNTSEEKTLIIAYTRLRNKNVDRASVPSGVSLLVNSDRGIKQQKGMLKKAPILNVL